MEQAVVKILLLGICGYGSNYIKEISERDIPGIKIEGICEVVPNAADLYPIIKEQNIPIYQTPEDFYKEHTADLAVVSTPIHLHYSQENGQGAEAVATTAIGLDIQRKAAVIGTKGSIYLDDFQKAETMTVSLSDGEEYEIEIPFEINGFEYQIREVSNCIRAGRTHSGIYTPQMSLQTLSLIDDIRASWNMKFPFEK